MKKYPANAGLGDWQRRPGQAPASRSPCRGGEAGRGGIVVSLALKRGGNLRDWPANAPLLENENMSKPKIKKIKLPADLASRMDELRAAGIKEEQARSARMYRCGRVATARTAAADPAGAQSEFATKAELKLLRSELGEEVERLRERLERMQAAHMEDITRLRLRMRRIEAWMRVQRWVVGANVVLAGVVLGVALLV